jgi:hypothetical protein
VGAGVDGATVSDGSVTDGPTDTTTRVDGPALVGGAVTSVDGFDPAGLPSGFNVVGTFREVGDPVFVVGGSVGSTTLTFAVDGIGLVVGAAFTVVGAAVVGFALVGAAVEAAGFVVATGFVVGVVGVGAVATVFAVVTGWVASGRAAVVGACVTAAVVESGASVSGGALDPAAAVVSAVVLPATVESAAAMLLPAAMLLLAAPTGGIKDDETGMHGCVVGALATWDVAGSELAGVATAVVSGVLDGVPAMVESADAVLAPGVAVEGSTHLGRVGSTGPAYPVSPQAIPRNVIAIAAIAFFMGFP